MDILIPFVDNSDSIWQEAFLNAHGLRFLFGDARKHFLDSMNVRYSSRGLFKYWWRAIEQNYRDLDTVHLLVMGKSQIPDFLVNDPRVKIHFHDEFIPKEFCPCFNSSVIELCAMKELELSPLYILSNDDMYANNVVTDDDLSESGRPKYFIRTLPKYQDTMFQGFLENGRQIVSRHYGKECPYYDWLHLWQVYDDRFCKEFLNEHWSEILDTMSRFREKKNVNHLMLMMAQCVSGLSVHSDSFPHDGYTTANNLKIDGAKLKNKKVICINDCMGDVDTEEERYLSERFKYPCSFEKFSSFAHGLPEPVAQKYTTVGGIPEQTYCGERHGEMFVHWYYIPRKVDTPTRCEAFHMNMFCMLDIPSRIKKIHIRICGDNALNTSTAKGFVEYIESRGCKVDIKEVPNSDTWEHDTFKECVEYAVSTGEYVYYLHFKGVTHFRDTNRIGDIRLDKHGETMNEVDLMYWCYLMYRGLFDPRGDNYIARGPLLRDGILRAYKTLNRNWSYTDTKNHYMGSFQAFDGKALSRRFDEMKMDRSARDKNIWIGNRYTVEQFLSLVFNPGEVYSILLGSLMSYSMHSDMRFGPYLRDFDNITCRYIPGNPIRCKKYAVLTYIFGNNEVLRPVTAEEDVDYVCVTDDENLTADGWKIIVDKLDWLKDPRSKYHYVKLHPFDYITAERVMIVDGSYQLSNGVKFFIKDAPGNISLKTHPKRNTIGEEIPEWIKSRNMSPKSAQLFWNIVKILSGNENCQLYEFDISVWNRSDENINMLEWAWKILISCSDIYDTFLSNQLAISLLAGTLYKGKVSVITEQIPWKKFKHNIT